MTIKYAAPKMETEFKNLPEAIQRVVRELDTFTKELGCTADVTVTCVMRTPEENAADGGVGNSLHLDGRAIDLRAREYTEDQYGQIESWLRRRCPRKAYEVITSPHGTGPHIHLGLRRSLNA